MLIDGRPCAASLAYVHPESDLTLLKTATANGQALALEDADLEETDTGYTFGFPGGQLARRRMNSWAARAWPSPARPTAPVRR